MSDAPTPATGASRDDGPKESAGALRMIVSVLVLIAVLAAGWWLLDDGADETVPAPGDTLDDPETPGADPVQAPAAAPVPVETTRARRGELVMRITATGNAEATRLLEIESATEGIVRALPVTEGAVVDEGDLLVQLDDTELRLELERNRESLVRALAAFAEKQAFLEEDAVDTGSLQELQRAWQQLAQGMISQETFRDTVHPPRFDELFATISRDEVMAAQDRLLSARADYRQAQMRLERAAVRAPFGGQVGRVEIVEGARLGSSAPLMTLVDADPIRVRVEVLESESGLVERGRRARVRFAAYPDRTFEGRVETISPTVDPESKTLEVIVSLPNPDLRLKPGMFAQITLDAQVFEDRLLVPADAVLVRDDRPLVFLVEGDRAQWVYIEAGLRSDEWVEVLDGVEPGDLVITDGHYTLAHDSLVRIVDDEGAGSADAGR